MRGEEVTGSAGLRAGRLLALIRERGRVEVSLAAGELAVSPETVRRDLRRLESQGLVRRAYGVAYPAESSSFETALADRSQSYSEEKQRIADDVARRIGSAQTVFFDEGYQAVMVARALPPGRELTIVTTSLPVAVEVSSRPDVQTIMVGGRVRGRTLGVVDSWAVDMLASLHLDLAVVGANGVTVEHGLTTPDPAVARVKAAAIAASRRRIFAGAHNKFGVTSFAGFAALADFEAMVTGAELGAAQARRFHAGGAALVLV